MHESSIPGLLGVIADLNPWVQCVPGGKMIVLASQYAGVR